MNDNSFHSLIFLLNNDKFYVLIVNKVKAPYIVHVSLLTSVGYNKKEANFKMFSQLKKEIVVLSHMCR